MPSKEYSASALGIVFNKLNADVVELLDQHKKELNRSRAITVKGQTVNSEQDLWDMYEADLLTPRQYDDILKKFRLKNKEIVESQKIYEEAVEFMKFYHLNAYQEYQEAKEREEMAETNKVYTYCVESKK